jgi:hypothetical protein
MKGKVPPRLGPIEPTTEGAPDIVCPVDACHRGPDAPMWFARVRAPDGRERVVWACVAHLPLEVGAVTSGLRTEPFDD